MYSLNISAAKYGFRYDVVLSLSDRSTLVTHGYRPNEHEARVAGHEDLLFCKGFRIGLNNLERE